MPGSKKNKSSASLQTKSPKRGKVEVKEEPIDMVNHKYFVFKSDTNAGFHAFETVEDAVDFLADYEPIVTDRRSFKIKKEYQAYVKAMQNQVDKKKAVTSPQPRTSIKPIDISPEQASAVANVVRKIEQFRPKNEVVVKWKTTGKSKACLLLVRFKDKLGKDAFTCKAKYMQELLPNFVPDFWNDENYSGHFNDELILNAFENATLAVMSRSSRRTSVSIDL